MNDERHGMSREDLVALVTRIVQFQGTEEEHDALIRTLEANVPDPNVSDLIFHTLPELTPAEIVDRAVAYRAIRL